MCVEQDETARLSVRCVACSNEIHVLAGRGQEMDRKLGDARLVTLRPLFSSRTWISAVSSATGDYLSFKIDAKAAGTLKHQQEGKKLIFSLIFTYFHLFSLIFTFF